MLKKPYAIIMILLPLFVFAQNDSTLKYISPSESVLRSALLPGAGQIKQERLWQASVFYGISVVYGYRSIYHYKRYKETKNDKLLNKAQKDFSIFMLVYSVNLFDSYLASSRDSLFGWDGSLLGDKPLKSPWGATARSAFIPGWGQFYNESYIKSAFYLGLVGYLIHEIDYNARQYEKTNKYKFEDDRIRFSWYLGLSYLFMLLDAHVDAYLYKFDKAVDLSISTNRENQFKLNLRIPIN